MKRSYWGKVILVSKIVWPVFAAIMVAPIIVLLINYFDPLLVPLWVFATLILTAFLAGIGLFHNIEKYVENNL